LRKKGESLSVYEGKRRDFQMGRHTGRPLRYPGHFGMRPLFHHVPFHASATWMLTQIGEGIDEVGDAIRTYAGRAPEDEGILVVVCIDDRQQRPQTRRLWAGQRGSLLLVGHFWSLGRQHSAEFLNQGRIILCKLIPERGKQFKQN